MDRLQCHRLRRDFLRCAASLVCVAALSSASQARLGETAQACVDRYGQPIEVVRDVPGIPCSMVFLIPGPQFSNKRVRCFFDAAEPTAVCKSIVYNNFGQELEVMESILQLNSEGSTWLQPKRTPNVSLGITNYDWQREDGATAKNHGDGLWIWGKEDTQKRRDGKQQELKDRVKGL